MKRDSVKKEKPIKLFGKKTYYKKYLGERG